MKLKFYHLDAFTDKLFGGNSAGVCPLQEWLPDSLMQQVAMENNLSETAFYVRESGGYRVRWFTPKVEVDLCGHATLAAAFVLFNFEGYAGNEISFNSRSGLLHVRKDNALLTLNFPSDELQQIELTAGARACFKEKPIEAWKGKSDLMLVFANENQVASLEPDLKAIAQLDARGLIATAKGDTVDFVSRMFAPQCGIDEDPATGSAHTTLTNYWAPRLGKKELAAIQLSARRAYLRTKDLGERVEISGNVVMYLEGMITVPVGAVAGAKVS